MFWLLFSTLVASFFAVSLVLLKEGNTFIASPTAGTRLLIKEGAADPPAFPSFFSAEAFVSDLGSVLFVDEGERLAVVLAFGLTAAGLATTLGAGAGITAAGAAIGVAVVEPESSVTAGVSFAGSLKSLKIAPLSALTSAKAKA